MITDAYKAQLKQTRARDTEWGSTAARNGGPEIVRAVQRSQNKLGVKSVLDFGCGLGTLGEYVRPRVDGIEWCEYDPSIDGKDTIPDRQFDLIVSTDVMEHIEPNSLAATKEWLFERASKAQFHMIACGPTNKKLPDGRDVHLIQRPIKWWQGEFTRPGWILMERGEVMQIRRGQERDRGWLYLEKL